jgi:hypothetical protein
MSDGKHTPGPWRYQEGTDAYTHIVRTGENRFLCQLAQDTSGVAEANARLIAAAPELLDAILKSDDAHWTTAMRVAITKAIGDLK